MQLTDYLLPRDSQLSSLRPLVFGLASSVLPSGARKSLTRARIYIMYRDAHPKTFAPDSINLWPKDAHLMFVRRASFGYKMRVFRL